MAMPKMHIEIMNELKEIKAMLSSPAKPAVTVTKEQLMEIKGVGSSTADEILKLLGQE